MARIRTDIGDGRWRRRKFVSGATSARRSRVLLLKHAQSDIAIDVILGGLPFEQEAVDRARAHRVGDITVRLPRVEDLIIMKVIAHRDKDMQDVEGLLDAHPDVNLEEIRQPPPPPCPT